MRQDPFGSRTPAWGRRRRYLVEHVACLLYTSDAADERSSVDLGGRRIIKKHTAVALPRVDSHDI